ncbi:hypothetical protein B296_00019298 [Ensete ventricosum]|uniref:Uncharacterized protein n=1 Tax=Ensete ventricosum TaxID=4639 RepID=A0A426Z8M2_ENSVE|nr:hypothetical protein B296_00019298 [Ensete ventricosum]
MTAISFARLQKERLNQEARRTRVTPRLVAPMPLASPTINRPSALKRLTREELRERSERGLCRHYDEPWSCEHHCKKGRLLVIEPIKEDPEYAEESLDYEEDDMEEEPQLADCLMHSLIDYANPQSMKVAIQLKQ